MTARPTAGAALAGLRRTLAEAGIDNPAYEARLLLAGVLGIGLPALALRSGRPLTEAEAATLEAFAARRLAREPVARILGEWEFWGLPFALSPDTLVPRPDTETVVEAALARIPDRSRTFALIDLGTGTGCLLVALLHECPKAWGLGIDRSPGALATARANARRNGVAERALFAASDWAAAVSGSFDLVVSNPPYIASPVIATLDPDVREHDPMAALDGGADGLDAYRRILDEAPRLLRPGGHLLLEIGYDQGESVPRLAAGLPLAIEEVRPDLSGNARCVALRRI
ncbi:MAG TPA: peptide chain release factor N(5)-glutamine methyltransferase [Microvirga sp.]